jgi:hypothetical protein
MVVIPVLAPNPKAIVSLTITHLTLPLLLLQIAIQIWTTVDTHQKVEPKLNLTSKLNIDAKTNNFYEPFLVAPRAMNLILTAVAILAVDFNIMPRRFIKCETYGQSIVPSANIDGSRHSFHHFLIGPFSRP